LPRLPTTARNLCKVVGGFFPHAAPDISSLDHWLIPLWDSNVFGPLGGSSLLTQTKNWATVERLARTGLRAAEIVQGVGGGVGPLTEVTAVARSVISSDLIPSVPGPMPRHAGGLPVTSMEGTVAVYFPACINRIFGHAPSVSARPSLPEALVAVSSRAGRPLWIPGDVQGLCCSTPFHSKGYMLAHQFMASAIVNAFGR
jgi:D-lactate dehydrogenase